MFRSVVSGLLWRAADSAATRVRTVQLLACATAMGSIAMVSQGAMMFTATQEFHANKGAYAGNASFSSSSYTNLTTYGATDWAYFGATGSGGSITKVNQMADGSGIGMPTYSDYDRTGTIYQGTSANTYFTFTNGTSPASGTNVSDPGASINRGGSIHYLNDPGPSITFSAPVGTGTNTLDVWFSGFGSASYTIAAFDGSTQIGSTVLVPAGGDQNHDAYVYELDYGGATTTSGLLSFTFGGVGGQDPDSITLNAAALTAAGPEVPEPAAAGLIALGSLGLLARRRARAQR